uniref:Uncharacterized protein n=1 Tax=Glossina pallidipes TaxID=7398 RepID=A0A1A9ZH22_GLOPL
MLFIDVYVEFFNNMINKNNYLKINLLIYNLIIFKVSHCHIVNLNLSTNHKYPTNTKAIAFFHRHVACDLKPKFLASYHLFECVKDIIKTSSNSNTCRFVLSRKFNDITLD